MTSSASREVCGFHPNVSRASDQAMAVFVESPLSPSLRYSRKYTLISFHEFPIYDSIIRTVPGIGEKTEELMKDNGISNTFTLIGKFLSFKEDGVGSIEHCDRFWYWLESINTPQGFRGSITLAIAKKVDLMIPGDK
jgi:hypothetical protein